MNQRISCRFRFSAVAGLLGIGCLWPLPAAAAGAVEKLQVLLNDTAAQIQLAYRQHPDERALRQEQLAAVITNWRAAPRNDANNERLATWLRAAINSSMPGSRESLPQAPSFVASIKIERQPVSHVETRATESAAEKKLPADPVAKPDVDPFRDDPETERK